MQVLVLTEAGVGVQALVCVGEAQDAEGRPVVFAQGAGDCFFADEGGLVQGGGVLRGRVSGSRRVGGGKERGLRWGGFWVEEWERERVDREGGLVPSSTAVGNRRFGSCAGAGRRRSGGRAPCRTRGGLGWSCCRRRL